MSRTIAKHIYMLLDNSFVSDARVEKECETLISAGHQVTVICVEDPKFPKEEKRNGVEILRWIAPSFNAPLRQGYEDFLHDISNKILELNPMYVHCHDFYMLSIGSQLKEKNPSIKLIYDAHEYLQGWPFYRTNKGINRLKGKLVYTKLKLDEKRNLGKIDRLVTITDEIGAKLTRISKLNTHPIIVGNYPKKLQLRQKDNYFQKEFSLDKDCKILIHSGTIYLSNEQLTELFNSLLTFPNICLVFIGNRQRIDEVKNMVRSRLDWEKKVFFHDYPSTQEKTIQLIHQGDIGLLHVNLKWEAHQIGFSNRFVEYLMAGIPVIGTAQNFTHKMNEQNRVAEFYNGKKVSSLIEPLHKILDNYGDYISEIEKIRKDLNWESESDKLIHLYQTL